MTRRKAEEKWKMRPGAEAENRLKNTYPVDQGPQTSGSPAVTQLQLSA